MHLPVPHSAPEYTSSEWIAHNAALRAKQALLNGEKPKIGSAYVPPTFKREPTIFIYPADPAPRWLHVIGWSLALPAALAVLYTIGCIGGF